MKTTLFVFTLVALTSCSEISSLYPISENGKNIVFKKELMGSWKSVKDKTEFTIDTLQRSGSIIYQAMIIDTNPSQIADTNHYQAILVDLKGKLFIDCITLPPSRCGNTDEPEWDGALPKHFIFKIYSVDNGSIVFAAIDFEKIVELMKQKKIILRHEVLKKDMILLLEKPESLQKKLLEFEKFGSVYTAKDTLVRIE